MLRRISIIAAATVLISCGWLSTTYKYEMIIETHSARGVEHWSAVREVIRNLSERAYSYNWRGEAIPIDLGNGHFAYALPIGSDRTKDYSSAVYLKAFGHGAQPLKGWLGATEIWPDSPQEAKNFNFAPMIVRFANDAAPDTLQVVPYDAEHPEIAPGVSVTRITIKRTTKPLIFSLVRRLPWLRSETQPAKLGPPWVASLELPDGLHSRDFIRGAHPPSAAQ